MAEPIHLKRSKQALEALGDVDDPLIRLDAARLLREQLETVEAETVATARQSGVTWKHIGALYGLSKQGAQQRFRVSSPAEFHSSPRPAR